jgi:RimJ/RimL family protein N-acetyltransferase
LNISNLFQGRKIYLTDWGETDAEIEARWSEDPSYLVLIQADPPRPLSVSQVRKYHRPNEESQDGYQFSIHEQGNDRIVGVASLRNIQWNHGLGFLFITIGDAEDRRQGYGSEALNLLLRFAFHEINLEHLLVDVFAYNLAAQQFFQKNGFEVEVRQREALLRFGQRWDRLIMGLTRVDWETGQRNPEGERDYGG